MKLVRISNKAQSFEYDQWPIELIESGCEMNECFGNTGKRLNLLGIKYFFDLFWNWNLPKCNCGTGCWGCDSSFSAKWNFKKCYSYSDRLAASRFAHGEPRRVSLLLYDRSKSLNHVMIEQNWIRIAHCTHKHSCEMYRYWCSVQIGLGATENSWNKTTRGMW